jgi:hypothetical protein
LPKNQLTPKHWKALELLEENFLSHKEVAKAVGWSEAHLNDLINAQTSSTDKVGLLFRVELEKINKRIEHRIRTRTRNIRNTGAFILETALDSEAQMIKKGKKVDKDMLNKACRVLNTLGKMGGRLVNNFYSHNYQFTYKGFTPEDLTNEFKRLSALAKQSLDGTRVSGTSEGEPGGIPPVNRTGDTLSEVEEDTLLRPDTED